MTHHEGGHGHAHEHHEHPHPGGFKHHGECPYCKTGEASMSKEEEISALEKYKNEISEQLNFVDKRIEELRSA
jgi:hypothetical protein